MAAQNAARAAQRAKNPQVKQALKDRGLNENYGARADGAAHAGRAVRGERGPAGEDAG